MPVRRDPVSKLVMWNVSAAAVALALTAMPAAAAAQIGYLWSFEERTAQADLASSTLQVVPEADDVWAEAGQQAGLAPNSRSLPGVQ